MDVHSTADINRDGGSSIINLKYENGIATYCCGTPVTNGTDVICPEGNQSFQIPTGHALTGVALLSAVNSSSARRLLPRTQRNDPVMTLRLELEWEFPWESSR